MQLDQSLPKPISSYFFYAVSGLLLLECELGTVLRLSGKTWGKTGMDGYVTPYLLPLLIALPLVCAFVFRRRLKKWELSGEISVSVSSQVQSFVAVMLFITYLIFSLLSSAR